MSRKYSGLLIEKHHVCDVASKEQASKTLSGWKQVELTAEEWCNQLTLGRTIQPSLFKSKEDGTFTHAKDLWQETHFVCADGDNIKGVEFNDDGTDKNPDGVEAWTEQDGLSKQFPELKSKVYAVGQSVSSMLDEKPPLHRRYRLIFLSDNPIESIDHYHQFLSKLADEFPIIPKVERSPAQPVYGNARDGFGFHICGNILAVDDYPFTPPETETKHVSQPRLDFDETLEEYLRRHRVDYTPSDEAGKYYVVCPYKENHTGAVNKPKDAYVFDDGRGWAFYCSHAHCKNHRTWDAFKRGYKITNGSGGTPKPKKAPKIESAPKIPDNPFFEGKKFLPLGMVNYLKTIRLHTLSLKHENFIRVYRDGIYIEEQGEILDAMIAALGERTFKMSQYNEVIDLLQKQTTPLDECEQSGYLNVKNGFLNVDTLELENHSPDRKSIIQMPVEFKPEASPDKISAWLTDCLNGDEEQERLFYEAVGYTLLQTTELQKMFFLLGRTQTGKSTAMHIIKGLIGEGNISAIELAPLDDEDNRFSRASIYDKIANFSCDISPKYLTGDGNIKKIVSGDPITGEYKFRSHFTFQPKCTLWAMANTLPPSGDKSDAWYQRLVILKFEKQFLSDGENKPDRKLKHKLTEPDELSGLLNVALLCGKDAVARGHFTQSQRNEQSIEEYKFLNDHVLKFISDLPDFENSDDSKFYDSYKDWCEAEGIPKPLSKTRLADSTQRHGIKRIRKKENGDRYFVWQKVGKS